MGGNVAVMKDETEVKEEEVSAWTLGNRAKRAKAKERKKQKAEEEKSKSQAEKPEEERNTSHGFFHDLDWTRHFRHTSWRRSVSRPSRLATYSSRCTSPRIATANRGIAHK